MARQCQWPHLVCLAVLSWSTAALAVCPDVDESVSDIQDCRDENWGKVLNTDAILTNTQACSHLQATVKCILMLTDGCEALEANYLAPALYPWAMTSDALQCGTTFDGEPLEFESDDCSFNKVYKCYIELFSLMFIQPKQKGEEVEIANLKTWLGAKTLLVEDRENFCERYINDRLESRFTEMSDCGDKLKTGCQKTLPMYDKIPEKPLSAEEDPYTMVGEIKALADKVCLDACADMDKKEDAANACRGEDFDTILADIKADNNRTGHCNNLKTVHDCMMTELNDCPYIVQKAEEARSSAFTEALAACNISPKLGKTYGRNPMTTGAAGVMISLTLMLTAVLAPLV